MHKILFVFLMGLFAFSIASATGCGGSGMSRDERADRLERIRGNDGNSTPAESNEEAGGGNVQAGMTIVGIAVAGAGALALAVIPFVFLLIAYGGRRLARWLMPFDVADDAAEAIWFWGWLEVATGIYALICFLAATGIGGLGVLFASLGGVITSLIPATGVIAALGVMIVTPIVRFIRSRRRRIASRTGGEGRRGATDL